MLRTYRLFLIIFVGAIVQAASDPAITSTTGAQHQTEPTANISSSLPKTPQTLTSGLSGNSWLDYKLRSFKTQRAPLYFAGMQLFFFLRAQAYPYQNQGYIASILGPTGDNQVGPLSEQNRSMRDLLNTLISRSTEGGMWVVEQYHPQSETISQNDPFWKLIPFGGSIQDALYRAGL